MAFWITALALTLGVVLVLARPLLRRSELADSDRAYDFQIYRDQLAEVENDLSRGVLSENEAARTRVEVSRRLLEADKALQMQDHRVGSSHAVNLGALAFIGIFILSSTLGVYVWLGADGAPDLPLKTRQADMASQQAQRPSQQTAEAQVGDITEMADAVDQSYRDLVAQLRETVGKRPDDLQGHELLATHEARLGRFAAAAKAKARAVELKGDGASGEDFTDLAELMIVAAGGYVSPEAEQALGEAIQRDVTNPRARYYSGLDLAQNGRPDLAYQLWSDLLAKGPDDAPWIAPIKEQIGDVARMAGIDATLPGPSRTQVEDAQNLSADDQQAMIKGMVARLSERLANEGGTVQEWARLINAYGVLKDVEKAKAILTEARQKFANDPSALSLLAETARAAGIPE